MPEDGYWDTTEFEYNINIYNEFDTIDRNYKINRNTFNGEGAMFTETYELKSTNDKKKYLAIGYSMGCNTCCYYMATVIELSKNSINFNYPAFSDSKEDSHSESKNISPLFILDSRCGDIQVFQFNAQKQTIFYKY